MPKTIIICCDGTNNQISGDTTNVLRLYDCLNRESQLTFYEPGVGTLVDPTALTAFRKFIQRNLDSAIGRSLCETFSNVYRFICEHYQPDDRICMFGFSRGAFNVRAVAGAINMFGLLRPELSHLASYVWAMYSNDGGAYSVDDRFHGANRFHRLFCIPEKPWIEFMGLWDTVSSFGWFWDFRSLPFTAYNPSIKLVRHAVSVDERRVAFPVNLFMKDGQILLSEQIKQVWFPGVHSDVGGGYADPCGGLSKISFQWMIEEIRSAGEIDLVDKVVDKVLGNTVEKRSKPDPTAQIHESLRGMWRLMEVLPRRQLSKVENHWTKKWAPPHLGQSRRIPSGAWIHSSVVHRREKLGYDPKLPRDYVVV